MSKAFSAFYDSLLPELPGCPTALLDHHLLHVAREVCDKTHAWRDTFPTIDSEVDTLAYYVATPETRSELVKIVQLTVGDRLWWRFIEPLPPVAGESVEMPRYPAHRPPFTFDAAREQITFNEQPEGEIVVVGAMRPMLTATVLPDILYTQQLQTLRYGVLSRLMRQGRKPWTDRDLSVDYEARFNAALNADASAAARGNTKAALRTRPTPF